MKIICENCKKNGIQRTLGEIMPGGILAIRRRGSPTTRDAEHSLIISPAYALMCDCMSITHVQITPYSNFDDYMASTLGSILETSRKGTV
jgi:hypothetical protein